MDVRELTSETERREAVPILRQLWSDVPPEDIMEWTGEEDYHLFGGFVESELIGIAGVLVRHVFHHARHAWLYDLVVDEPHRGEGHGTELVGFVEEWVNERSCGSVALASPLAKDNVHRYYESQGYEKWGYVVEKEL